MIVFHVRGGLGNQLFQYATARRLALQHGCPLVADHHWFIQPRPGVTPRELELTRYPVAMRLASPFELLLWTPLRSRLGPFLSPVMPLDLLREQGYCVNKNVLSARPSSYLVGYWQSETYFADIREYLLTEFTPAVPPSPEDVATIELMEQCDAISVHVRRGDYVNLASAAAYHGLCGLGYYQRAIGYIAGRVHNPALFIFSDDLQWVRSNLQPPLPTFYVDHNSEKAFQDLRLMSHCKHHVIANSSFSWWGAWLANPSNQIVVAPAKWFKVDRPTPDLLPSHWIRL